MMEKPAEQEYNLRFTDFYTLKFKQHLFKCDVEEDILTLLVCFLLSVSYELVYFQSARSPST